MATPLRILAFSGSLRAESCNTAVLKTAIDLAPSDVVITQYDYSDLPFYNEDLGEPDSVKRLRSAISDADGVLLFQPEYNYCIPGPLKNAIDWASRPGYDSAFYKKPCGVLSASPAMTGGARGQQATKVILLAMASHVFPAPEFALGQAYGKVDDGRLTDDDSRERLGEFLSNYADWVRLICADN